MKEKQKEAGYSGGNNQVKHSLGPDAAGSSPKYLQPSPPTAPKKEDIIDTKALEAPLDLSNNSTTAFATLSNANNDFFGVFDLDFR